MKKHLFESGMEKDWKNERLAASKDSYRITNEGKCLLKYGDLSIGSPLFQVLSLIMNIESIDLKCGKSTIT